MSKTKLFDYCIGNPPYQEQVSDSKDNSSLSKQLFPVFIQESTKIATQIMLITPSRWFAGDAQDKSFVKLREFMRENNHIKTLCNYKDAKAVFPNAEIKGGVSYFLYDNNYTGKVQFVNFNKGSEEIETRNLFEEGLDVIIGDSTSYSILKRVTTKMDFEPITKITKGRNAFGIIGKQEVIDTVSSASIFDGAIELRCKNNVIRWTSRNNVSKNKELIDKYKIFISKSAGNPGKDMKVIGYPYIGKPASACTDSLIPIGEFNSEKEAYNLTQYIKTRFFRYMVSIVKMSQNVTQIVYKFVPLQDFTANSDIDWSKSIHEIDLQLYKKYGLNDDEINFIETNVKEMS